MCVVNCTVRAVCHHSRSCHCLSVTNTCQTFTAASTTHTQNYPHAPGPGDLTIASSRSCRGYSCVKLSQYLKVDRNSYTAASSHMLRMAARSASACSADTTRSSTSSAVWVCTQACGKWVKGVVSEGSCTVWGVCAAAWCAGGLGHGAGVVAHAFDGWLKAYGRFWVTHGSTTAKIQEHSSCNCTEHPCKQRSAVAYLAHHHLSPLHPHWSHWRLPDHLCLVAACSPFCLQPAPTWAALHLRLWHPSRPHEPVSCS